METSTTDLRKSFNDQLKEVTEKINSLSAELNAAQEFRIKLIGGLETLQIIDPEEENVTDDSSEQTSE